MSRPHACPHCHALGAPYAPAAPAESFAPNRLLALDVYRGLIMISLSFVGFGLARTADLQLARDPDSVAWRYVRQQFEHVEWVGAGGYWDLVQPSFMYMVGVAMAYSLAKRAREGHAYWPLFRHALTRSLGLIALGIFLISNGSASTEWSLVNVLTQIGLAYPLLFLLWGRSWRVQLAAGCAIIVGTWLLYELFPHAGIDGVRGDPAVGISAEWAQQHLTGVRSAWHKNANVGHWIDVRLLNGFPRAEPFRFSQGGYASMNFLPSVVTMLSGLMAGEWLRSSQRPWHKFQGLFVFGVLLIAMGYYFHTTGICPLIKRLWTPSWAIYSSGCCCVILSVCYALVDLLHVRWWTYPFVVVGSNSLAVYGMFMLLSGWVKQSLRTHLGPEIMSLKVQIGTLHWDPIPAAWREELTFYQPTIDAMVVGCVFWLISWWLYRQRLFVRL